MTYDDTRMPTAIVTGGSRGIGSAIVTRLANAGYRGAFCYRTDEMNAQSTLDQVGHGTWTTRQVDVRNFTEVDAFVRDTADELGGIDVVVHSAGVTRDSPLAVMSTESWSDVIDTNLTGAFNLCRASSTQFIRARQGSVILIGSVIGRDGNEGQVNYAASKAGLVGLCRAAARELARWNTRVNVIAPGFVDTDMTGKLSQTHREHYLERIPLGRFGSPEEIARLAEFLASSDSSYITGQVIGVDGGLTV